MNKELECQLAMINMESFYKRGKEGLLEEFRLLKKVWDCCPRTKSKEDKE